MRAGYQPNRIVIGVAAFLVGIGAGQVGLPVWRTAVIAVMEESYQKVTYKCDRAMREHLIAKSKIYQMPAKDTVVGLRAAEVGLLDCQDYDLIRKRLIQWGLTDNDLSLMALREIEAKDRDLQKVIEIHEIRY